MTPTSKRRNRRPYRRKPPATIATWTHVIALMDRGLFAVPAWVAEEFMTEEFMDRTEDRTLEPTYARTYEHLRNAIGYLQRMFDIEDPKRVVWAGTAADAVKLILLGRSYSNRAGIPVPRIVLPERTDLAPGEWTRWVISAPVGSSDGEEYPRDVEESPDEEAWLLARFLALYGVRNTVLENFHAGKGPATQTGDYADVAVHTPAGVIPWANESRITDLEMRELMLDVEKHLARFIQEILRRERSGCLPTLLARIRRDHFGPAGISWDRPPRPSGMETGVGDRAG